MCIPLLSCGFQPCYNDVLETPHGGFGEDEDSQADWGLSLATLLTDHSSAHERGAVAGGTINSWIDEAWKVSHTRKTSKPSQMFACEDKLLAVLSFAYCGCMICVWLVGSARRVLVAATVRCRTLSPVSIPPNAVGRRT